MTKKQKLNFWETKEYFPKNSGKYISEEKIIKEMEKEDKKLLAKQKSYEELIKSVSGIVKSFELNNQATSHIPMNEMVMGGIFPVYKTGYQSDLEIIIESEDSSVKKLLFKGNCYIHEGDRIKAYIFAGEKKELNSSYSTPPFSKKGVLIPRKLSEKETTLYIEKIQSGKIIERYNSVDYNSNLHKLKQVV